MPDDWQREALRAQPVVARSYALATLKPGALFDLYADTRSQVYGGIPAEAASTNRAIGSTAGRVVSWNGQVATTYYHSTSGGRTASNEEAWPGAAPVPYLVSVSDPYDGLSKLHRWGPFPWTPAEVGRKLGIGVVRDLVVSRGPSGRAAEVTIKGRSGARTMLAQDFRRALDLRSTWFAVRVLNLEQPQAVHWLWRGAGRPERLRAWARQGAARAAGERRNLDDCPARAVAARRALHREGGAEAGNELPPGDAARRRWRSDRQRPLTHSLHGLTRPSRRSGYRPAMGRLLLLAATVAAFLAYSAPAEASPYVRYGLQDDAWLVYGPGTLDERIAELDRIGVDLVRFTINWNQVEKVRGKRSWGSADAVLEGLSKHGIAPVVTLYGAPRWANGGRAPNWAPRSGATFAAFAAAAANRYSWVKLWLVWNEPNQRRWLRPTTPQTYVTKLLNPAYTAIHNATPDAKVGGGITAPRASTGGVSPVTWIRGMAPPGPPRCLRAQPVSTRPLRDPLDRRLRALRDDHDGDARAAAARGVASWPPSGSG